MIADLAVATPRFGFQGALRENVSVSLVYNHSIKQSVRDWENAHKCATEHVNESRIAKPFHALKRFALCNAIPFAAQVLLSDLSESAIQVIQLQEGTSGFELEGVRKLLFTVRGHHESQHHTLLVGHSQGTLMIAEAIRELPVFERKPLNVGNYCTAVLALASPVARSSYSLESQYLRGLIVEGDILLQMGLPNDFPRIRTPAGDSVDALGLFARKLQGVHAHYVDPNYLRNEDSADSVRARLTELSDECSGGRLTISPSTLSMQVGDTARLGVVLTSRTGRLLKGRGFTGRSDGAFVNGTDSTIVATHITTTPNEIDVSLDNTAKVKAHISASVSKRRIITEITWTEEGMYWLPIAPGEDYAPGSDPAPCGVVTGRFLAVCRFRYDIKATSYDGRPLTYVSAMPLNHPAMGEPNRLNSIGDPAPTVLQGLIFESTVPAATAFEVSVTDSPSSEGRPVAVDTVFAKFDHRIPWPYASANLLKATFGAATPAIPTAGVALNSVHRAGSETSLQQPATLPTIPTDQPNGRGQR